jgi:hypothetical protein
MSVPSALFASGFIAMAASRHEACVIRSDTAQPSAGVRLAVLLNRVLE